MSQNTREVTPTGKFAREVIALTAIVGVIFGLMAVVCYTGMRELVALRSRGEVGLAAITKVSSQSYPGHWTQHGSYVPPFYTYFYDFTYGPGHWHGFASSYSGSLQVGDLAPVTYVRDDPRYVYFGELPKNALEDALRGWKFGFMLLGGFYLGALLLQIVIYRQEKALLAEGYPVYGRVLAVDRKGRPSYSFVDSSGREHERVARVRTGLQVGASVEVIHPAGRPHRSRMMHEVKRVRYQDRSVTMGGEA